MPELKLSPDILSAALIGFEVQKIAVDAKIAELRKMIGDGRAETASPAHAPKQGKKRSAAVRRKMALAQRARYAKLKPAPEPPAAAKPKRKVSAAARKRMALAQKKRWAAIKAAPAQTASVKKAAAVKTAVAS